MKLQHILLIELSQPAKLKSRIQIVTPLPLSGHLLFMKLAKRQSKDLNWHFRIQKHRLVQDVWQWNHIHGADYCATYS